MFFKFWRKIIIKINGHSGVKVERKISEIQKLRKFINISCHRKKHQNICSLGRRKLKTEKRGVRIVMLG